MGKQTEEIKEAVQSILDYAATWERINRKNEENNGLRIMRTLLNDEGYMLSGSLLQAQPIFEGE